eukprot:Skav236592  [mRNA]  locus=scaffold415:88630:91230:+ [translate_table: standard]
MTGAVRLSVAQRLCDKTQSLCRNLFCFGSQSEGPKIPVLEAPPGLEVERFAHRDVACDSMMRTPSAVSEIQELVLLRNHSCRVKAVVDEALPSIGSFGHPELCAPPCVYFAWGPCAKGAYCSFCHLAHRQPIGKLDKRQRKVFQKLEEVGAETGEPGIPIVGEYLRFIEYDLQYDC